MPTGLTALPAEQYSQSAFHSLPHYTMPGAFRNDLLLPSMEVPTASMPCYCSHPSLCPCYVLLPPSHVRDLVGRWFFSRRAAVQMLCCDAVCSIVMKFVLEQPMSLHGQGNIVHATTLPQNRACGQRRFVMRSATLDMHLQDGAAAAYAASEGSSPTRQRRRSASAIPDTSSAPHEVRVQVADHQLDFTAQVAGTGMAFCVHLRTKRSLSAWITGRHRKLPASFATRAECLHRSCPWMATRQRLLAGLPIHCIAGAGATQPARAIRRHADQRLERWRVQLGGCGSGGQRTRGRAVGRAAVAAGALHCMLLRASPRSTTQHHRLRHRKAQQSDHCAYARCGRLTDMPVAPSHGWSSHVRGS